ncbi:MAG: tol-pal system YbgF family protein [Thiohalomonadales bacterium]
MKINRYLFIVLYWVSNPVISDHAIDKAYSSFQDENYEEAQILYSYVKGFSGRMGEGSSAYRLEDYTHAIQQYTLALLKANTDNKRYKSLFNLANAYYKDDEYIKAIETYKYLLIYNPDSEEAQANLWSAQSILIDKIKNNKLFVNKESVNYDEIQSDDEDKLLEKDEKISKTEKIGYLRTLIGDRVAEGELNAIAQNDESINNLVLRAKQIKNYLSAVKKLEFVKDEPQTILKSIVDFEEKQN